MYIEGLTVSEGSGVLVGRATGSHLTGAIWRSICDVGEALGRLLAWGLVAGGAGRWKEGEEVGAAPLLLLLFELDEPFCVNPFTFSSSAMARNELSSSWATLTSPWYMKFNTATSSWYLTPFR